MLLITSRACGGKS